MKLLLFIPILISFTALSMNETIKVKSSFTSQSYWCQVNQNKRKFYHRRIIKKQATQWCKGLARSSQYPNYSFKRLRMNKDYFMPRFRFSGWVETDYRIYKGCDKPSYKLTGYFVCDLVPDTPH